MVDSRSSDAAVLVNRSRSSGLVWATALQPEATGIGVVQRQMYPRLGELKFQVVTRDETSNRTARAVRSFLKVIGPRYAAALVCGTPTPLIMRVPFVAIIYDLRYRRTRNFPTRVYHHLNLRRTVRKANYVFAISERTREELVDLFPYCAGKSSVLHLGPGNMNEFDFAKGEEGTVLLVGRADYKRNELVANAFALARPNWVRRFLCVGVSDETFQTLVEAFGYAACERFNGVSEADMRHIYQRAEVYVSASMEEGFGLPSVEALCGGCQVIAIRQPLTAEVLGDAAVLIEDGGLSKLADQLRKPNWINYTTRHNRASTFSWSPFVEQLGVALELLITPDVDIRF